MKHVKTTLMAAALIIIFAVNAFSQIVVIGQSSEWEATGFNNGRRVVRDCSMPGIGFNHYVWHSQNNPMNAPNGNNCDVFYACTDDFGAFIIPPTNMTQFLGYLDNRYPSIAIENDGIDSFGNWRTFNNIHLVWQCKQFAGANYEVMHAIIPVGNPPAPPAMLINILNLSNTPTNSLVPAVDINHYNPDPVNGQQIHVVWQEENVAHAGGVLASDIYYTRSINSGLNFNGPISGGLWDNITNTARHSQMPSIACSIDTFFGFPLNYAGGDCDYASNNVHVSFNENTPLGGVHVYYLRSATNGASWGARQNITMATGGAGATCDGYPNISCDMIDYVHIVFMRNVAQHTPSVGGYLAGINPINLMSFPGPDPGMYNGRLNSIVYWSSNPWAAAFPGLPGTYDREFPTVALDRFQNVSINWHECQVLAGGVSDYEVPREYCFNLNAPARPLLVPNYGGWAVGPNIDSADIANEDLFPNLAHKKVSMYLIRVLPFPGFTEIWTKVMGLGSGACTAPNAKNINMLSNTLRDAAVN